MHGQLVVIVYTSMCTSIVLLTFQINIELNHKRVCMAETVLSTGHAINTCYEIQTHDYQLNVNLRFN